MTRGVGCLLRFFNNTCGLMLFFPFLRNGAVGGGNTTIVVVCHNVSEKKKNLKVLALLF